MVFAYLSEIKYQIIKIERADIGGWNIDKMVNVLVPVYKARKGKSKESNDCYGYEKYLNNSRDRSPWIYCFSRFFLRDVTPIMRDRVDD